MAKKHKNPNPIKKGIPILIGFFGILILLGELGITGIGRDIYTFFKVFLGEAAWISPFVFLVIAFIVSLYSKGERPPKKTKGKKTKPSQPNLKSKPYTKKNQSAEGEDKFNSKITLPKGKLVDLKGFGEYFTTPEGPDISSSSPMEEFEELGRDFNTYFNEGHDFTFKSLGMGTRLESLRGFSSYFDEVSAEIEDETKQYTRPDTELFFPEKRKWDNYPGQVSSLFKLEPKAPSSGISVAERQELLGKEIHSNPSHEEPSLDVLSVDVPTVDVPSLEVPTVSVPSLEVPSLEVTTVDKPSLDIPSEDVPSVGLNKNLIPRRIPFDYPQSDGNQPQKLISWKLPEINLFDPVPQTPLIYDEETQKHLERVLSDFGIQAKVIRVARGPVITRYELAPAPGVKISRIVNLADDIALGLAARDVRIEAPIPGKAAIGIEVPNKQPRSVPFREVLETPEFKESSSKLRIALGKDIANQSVIADLAKMPHLLVAGATGSGKSVCITALINSLLTNARPNEVKFLMVDPKMVELSIYNGIPHLLAPVVTDPKKAAAALKWVVKEMETRYGLFAAAGVRDIERYNRMKSQQMNKQEASPALPWIVVIIDELADLMMVAANEVEEAICRLAQMARAAGIHLVIATQRPSVDVITGVIKANIPSRISFAVSSQIDSRTILDATGAEKLLGRGDMLYSPQGLNKPLRVQGCWVTDDEVQRMITFWKAQGRPEYLDPEGFNSLMAASEKSESTGPDDELFVEAGRLIITSGMASVSFLQRKLKLGYARAARLMDLLEENGIVGGYEGSKPRQVLISIEDFEERFG